MNLLNDWEQVVDISGVTVYCKKVNGYEREVYYSPETGKWYFKKWTKRSSVFPEVGSMNSLKECIEECVKENKDDWI